MLGPICKFQLTRIGTRSQAVPRIANVLPHSTFGVTSRDVIGHVTI